MSVERSNNYYDEIYMNSLKYKCHYKDSEYFKLWTMVMSKIPKTVEITELGCGSGQFANMLIDSGYKYNVGYDFSQEAINQAKEQLKGISFKRIDLTENKISGDFFIALEIFEHTKDFRIIENIGLGNEIVFTVPDFNDASHVRYFRTVNDVVLRYNNVIKFEYIEKFYNWFICKGVTI